MLLTFQQIIANLNHYWQQQGCTLIQPYDMQVGAGTFHPATCLRSIGPEPWSAAYVQPSRRPTDGRYGDNPNRLQHYYQYQVLLKPSPANMQELYLASLKALGIDFSEHDVRFIEDDWESPTLGAWGLGWEVWLNGMEVTQYTYFQQVGGLPCRPVSGELTYGLERLAMYLQGVDNVYDLTWSQQQEHRLSYGDIFLQNEQQQSAYNFDHANIKQLQQQFAQCEQHCQALIKANLPLPAYEQVITASHYFNLLDARRAISVTERQRFIFRVRQLAAQVAQAYYHSREQLQFPLGNITVKPAQTIGTPSITANDKTTHVDIADWLFELGCEELPSKVIRSLTAQLPLLISKTLHKENLNFVDIRIYSSPRRLAFIVSGLGMRQTNQQHLRKGPQISAPDKAVIGFAKSCGVDVAQLQQHNIDGKDYFVFQQQQTAQATADLIPNLVPAILNALNLPKSMHWGDASYTFCRPVRWLTCVFGKQNIAVQAFGLTATGQSFGHRFLSEAGVNVNASNYLELLQQHHVIADRQQRQQMIIDQVQNLAQQQQASIHINPNLLEEVTDLTEQPFAILGQFPQTFLQLPKECLISTLETHQKYFTLVNEKQQLLPYFITISNIPGNANITKGNEKVVIARLQDSLYFWHHDQQQPLQHKRAQLSKLSFAATKTRSAGNMLQKSQRLEQLCLQLQPFMTEPTVTADLQQAAALCKCDLLTDMVKEFPELQGTMGYYYSKLSAYNETVALAIAQHYKPRFADDNLPSTATAAVLAIADKLDSIVAIFALGFKADANKDPFALRRAALGFMRILAHYPLNTSLQDLIDMTATTLNEQLQLPIHADLQQQVRQFLWQRFRQWLQHEKGYRSEQLQAVFSENISEPLQQPNDCLLRLQALNQFEQLPTAALLSDSNRRINNLINNNEHLGTSLFKQQLLHESAEVQLHQTYQQLKQQPSSDYLNQLQQLTQLAQPLNQFFEQVMVMVEDETIRCNRLRLLLLLQQQLQQHFDISALKL